MRILIVDDDGDLRDAVTAMLARHEFAVECAGGAEPALKCTESGQYDFVLVDYRMPDKDGCWFLERAHLPRQTKVILVTAYLDRAMINRMFQLGASGYLIKPFKEADLMRHISFFVR